MIVIVAAQSVDASLLADIHARFAEHLHGAGDAAAATQQWVATIGTLAPSRAVRRLLAPSDAPHLRRYLEALLDHAGGGAAPEHSALLLACLVSAAGEGGRGGRRGEEGGALASGEDAAREGGALAAFVERLCGGASPCPVRIDVDAAIQTLRCAGHSDHALRLARCFGRDCFAILMYDLDDPDAALALASTLACARGSAALLAALLAHGRALLERRPEATVALLLERLSLEAPQQTQREPPSQSQRAEQAEVGSAVAPPGAAAAAATGAQPAATSGASADGFCGAGRWPLAAVAGLFDRQPGWLVVLLERLHANEAVAHQSRGPGRAWEALLALYLEADDVRSEFGCVASAPSPPPLDRPTRHSRALALLRGLLERRAGAADMQRALMVCAAHGFGAGLELLAGAAPPAALLQHQAETGQLGALLATCATHGAQQPQLWLRALRHAAQSGDARLLSQTVAAVESEALLAPLALVGTLHGGTLQEENCGTEARSAAGPPLSAVAPYLSRCLARDAAAATEAEAEAARYEADALRFASECRAVEAEGRAFDLRRCSACAGELEPPSVHFFCLHAFHRHCLGPEAAHGEAAGGEAPECPTCAPQRRRAREHAAMVGERAKAHDAFYRALDEAEDGFGAVADFFSKGVLAPLAG